MDTTILQHVHEDIAANLTEASRGDLTRSFDAAPTGLEIYHRLLSEQQRLTVELRGTGASPVAGPDAEGQAFLALDCAAYGEHLAARFRESARALEKAFAARDDPDARRLCSGYTMAAMAMARRLAHLLGICDEGVETGIPSAS